MSLRPASLLYEANSRPTKDTQQTLPQKMQNNKQQNEKNLFTWHRPKSQHMGSKGGSVSSRPACPTAWVLGQPELTREIPSLEEEGRKEGYTPHSMIIGFWTFHYKLCRISSLLLLKYLRNGLKSNKILSTLSLQKVVLLILFYKYTCLPACVPVHQGYVCCLMLWMVVSC